ncbi:MAG: hypothetical protein AAGG69_07645 [Pseudomonadota bacterium]
MKLDSIILIIVAIGAGLYFLAMLAGAIVASAYGVGIPMVILLLIGLWILVRVINDRRSNAEDDYYEKIVEK